MMSSKQLALGVFRFETQLGTDYSGLNRTSTFNWSSTPVFDGFANQQYTGKDDKIQLEGVVYPYHAGGLEQLNGMREMAGKGQPLQMVDGEGFNRGKWIITQVTEKQSHLLETGAALKQSFTLSLVRYE